MYGLDSSNPNLFWPRVANMGFHMGFLILKIFIIPWKSYFSAKSLLLQIFYETNTTTKYVKSDCKKESRHSKVRSEVPKH